jgi:exodeoxyribonuclease-3
MTIKIITWSANCLIQRYYKGQLKWIFEEDPDIFCVQDTQATKELITKNVPTFDDYYDYFSSSTLSPNQGGTAIYSKIKPLKVERNFERNNYFDEGWVLKVYFKNFILLNIHFPNLSYTNKIKEKQLLEKIKLYENFLNLTESVLNHENNVLICGDLNIAHKPKDIANPEKKFRKPGFLQLERAIIDRLIAQGYSDVFRIFNKEGENYTWWNPKNGSEKNTGMRLDYFFVSDHLKEKIKNTFVIPDNWGSEHKPLGIELKID